MEIAEMLYSKGFQNFLSLIKWKQSIKIVHNILGISQNIVNGIWEYLQRKEGVYEPGNRLIN